MSLRSSTCLDGMHQLRQHFFVYLQKHAEVCFFATSTARRDGADM